MGSPPHTNRYCYVDPAGRVRVGTVGGAERVLALPGRPPGLPVLDGLERPVWPCWSPCGDWIAAPGVREDSYEGGVFLFNLRQPRRARWFPLSSGPLYLSWLPGRRRVGAVLQDGGGLRLLAIDFTRQAGALTSIGHGAPLYYDASSAGEAILIHEGEKGSQGVVELRDGEGRTIGRPLTEKPGLLRSPAFSPDGRLLAYGEQSEEGDEQTDLHVIDLERHRLRPPVTFMGRGASAFSPDGRHLFLAAGEIEGLPLLAQVVLIPTWGGDPTLLYEGAISSVEWAGPDHLLAVVATEGGIQSLLLNRRGQPPRPLLTPTQPTPEVITASRFFDQLSRSHPAVSADARFALISVSGKEPTGVARSFVQLVDLEEPTRGSLIGPGSMPAWQLSGSRRPC